MTLSALILRTERRDRATAGMLAIAERLAGDLDAEGMLALRRREAQRMERLWSRIALGFMRMAVTYAEAGKRGDQDHYMRLAHDSMTRSWHWRAIRENSA